MSPFYSKWVPKWPIESFFGPIVKPPPHLVRRAWNRLAKVTKKSWFQLIIGNAVIFAICLVYHVHPIRKNSCKFLHSLQCKVTKRHAYHHYSTHQNPSSSCRSWTAPKTNQQQENVLFVVGTQCMSSIWISRQFQRSPWINFSFVMKINKSLTISNHLSDSAFTTEWSESFPTCIRRLWTYVNITVTS